MKKALILIIAGLVLCGLVFAAGCTGTSSEPVAGEWKWAEGNGPAGAMYKFNADGTCVYSYAASSSSVDADGTEHVNSYSGSEDATWTKNGNEYTVAWMDSTTSVFTYDASAKTLTSAKTGAVLIRK